VLLLTVSLHQSRATSREHKYVCTNQSHTANLVIDYCTVIKLMVHQYNTAGICICASTRLAHDQHACSHLVSSHTIHKCMQAKKSHEAQPSNRTRQMRVAPLITNTGQQTHTNTHSFIVCQAETQTVTRRHAGRWLPHTARPGRLSYFKTKHTEEANSAGRPSW